MLYGLTGELKLEHEHLAKDLSAGRLVGDFCAQPVTTREQSCFQLQIFLNVHVMEILDAARESVRTGQVQQLR